MALDLDNKIELFAYAMKSPLEDQILFDYDPVMGTTKNGLREVWTIVEDVAPGSFLKFLREGTPPPLTEEQAELFLDRISKVREITTDEKRKFIKGYLMENRLD